MRDGEQRRNWAFRYLSPPAPARLEVFAMHWPVSPGRSFVLRLGGYGHSITLRHPDGDPLPSQTGVTLHFAVHRHAGFFAPAHKLPTGSRKEESIWPASPNRHSWCKSRRPARSAASPPIRGGASIHSAPWREPTRFARPASRRPSPRRPPPADSGRRPAHSVIGKLPPGVTHASAATRLDHPPVDNAQDFVTLVR
jgi:hypothetical protein